MEVKTVVALTINEFTEVSLQHRYLFSCGALKSAAETAKNLKVRIWFCEAGDRAEAVTVPNLRRKGGTGERGGGGWGGLETARWLVLVVSGA